MYTSLSNPLGGVLCSHRPTFLVDEVNHFSFWYHQLRRRPGDWGDALDAPQPGNDRHRPVSTGPPHSFTGFGPGAGRYQPLQLQEHAKGKLVGKLRKKIALCPPNLAGSRADDELDGSSG